MTLAAVKPRSRSGTVVPDPIEALLHELVAEQGRQRETLATILRLLERGRGARDAADVALLVAVAEAFGDRTFTSAQVVALAHAQDDPSLRDALRDADVTTPQELGCVLRRIEGLTLSGLRLKRVGDQRAGIQWQAQVCGA